MLFARPGLKTVFCNVQSLDAAESVDEFKFRMNFMAKLCASVWFSILC